MAFQLAEAFVEFNSRGLPGVYSAIDRVGGSFRRAIGLATSFQSKLAAIGIGVSAGAMLKLAADAETAKVKFEVLLGSADKAVKMVAEIDQFAAKTPFGKLEIADATQKLLAFGSAEDKVMGQLRSIGDIAALTGVSIGDLADIYGKAQVQGRIFAEDINQLTGRGIPIIGELAKQFGVAESEVRGLVSSGKVTAENIQQAFTDMTSGAGQFAGGMERLSQTISGRFSTALDNIRLQATAVGTVFNPLSGAVLDFVIDSTEALGTVLGPSLELIGDTIEDVFGDGFGEFSTDTIEETAKELQEFTAFALDQIGGLAETGGPLFDELAGLAGDLAGVLGGFAFDGLGNAGDVFGSIVPAVTSTVQFVRSSLAELDPVFASLQNLISVSVDTAVSVLASLPPALSGLFGSLDRTGEVEFLTGLIDSASQLIEFVSPAVPIVAGFFAAWASGPIVFGAVSSAVATVVSTVGAIMSPLGAAVAGIGFLTASIASSESAMASFEALALTVFPVIGDLMTAAGEISATLLDQVLSLWGGFDSGAGVLQATGDRIGVVADWMTALLDGLGFAARNWQELLIDMATGTGAVLTNIGRNLGEFYEAVKSWISGDGFNFKAVDLFDGFKSSLEELPDLTAAQVEDTTAELDKLYAELGAADAEHLAEQRRRRKEAADKEQADRLAAAEQAVRDAELRKKIDQNPKGDDDKKTKEEPESDNKTNGKSGFSGLEEFAKSVQLAALGVDEKTVEKEQLEEQKKTNTILSTGLGVPLPAAEATVAEPPVPEVPVPVQPPMDHPATFGEIPGFELGTPAEDASSGSGLSPELMAEMERFKAERQNLADSRTQRPVAPNEDDGISRAIAIAQQQAALDAAGLGEVVAMNQGVLQNIIAFAEANQSFSRRTGSDRFQPEVQAPEPVEEFQPAIYRPSRRREAPDADASGRSRREIYLASQGREAPDAVSVEAIAPPPVEVTASTPEPIGVDTLNPPPIDVGLRIPDPEGVSATAEDSARPYRQVQPPAEPSVTGAATEPPQSPSQPFNLDAFRTGLDEAARGLSSFAARLSETLTRSAEPDDVFGRNAQDRAAVGFDAQLQTVAKGLDTLIGLESKSLDQLRTTHNLMSTTGVKVQSMEARLG